MKRACMIAIALALTGLFPAGAAMATSGPGCLRVVNVESWDALNVRARRDHQKAPKSGQFWLPNLGSRAAIWQMQTAESSPVPFGLAG